MGLVLTLDSDSTYHYLQVSLALFAVVTAARAATITTVNITTRSQAALRDATTLYSTLDQIR
ncbi:hypothetical protein J6590_006040 [Homalodisca vitripennis]|nr:hypothetical protein J6590_006040 [Homalodisca vitripennis]